MVKTRAGNIHPLGISRLDGGLNIAFSSKSANCSVVFYDRKSEEVILKVSFPTRYRVGDIHTLWLEKAPGEEFLYEFIEGEKAQPDVYARRFWGSRNYPNSEDVSVGKSWFSLDEYDWEEDNQPRIPYEESIVYCLHVRGFTKHASSGVKAKGTFAGIVEKIPYLKELGITTIELQPAYEYVEVEQGRLNYWGYKKGYYYSPKKSFSSNDNVIWEFKNLVKELHKNAIELVMQFYFPWEITEKEVSDILRFWITEYHIDGFHLKGDRAPLSLLCEDPCFSKTKIWYYEFPNHENTSMSEMERNAGIYGGEFRDDMRRFLKGDEGMISKVLMHLRDNPSYAGKINYISNYDGFTLMDLVSYERKQNDANGEGNKDGTSLNYSWNCGAEGKSRKRAVKELRIKQIKNALCLLFLSQGTPLIYMGDEFGNSQGGNNNPYCQDNEITWLDWENVKNHCEILEFVKYLVSVRKEHPILRMEKPLRLMDYLSCGYPDLSYHGEVPWKPEVEYYSRQVGILLCGKYAEDLGNKEQEFLYLGFNMHWETHDFALPRIPRERRWELLFGTEQAEVSKKEEVAEKVKLPPRSIFVYRSKRFVTKESSSNI